MLIRLLQRKRAQVSMAALILSVAAAAPGAELRIGIIGADTSHVTAFTEILNNPAAKAHVAGGKVVALFKGGSPDIPGNSGHVEQYSKTLREKYGVRIYDSVGEMCRDVDAILLESVDGRPHLEQFKQVVEARGARSSGSSVDPAGAAGAIPVFIDKPVAASLKDALKIFKLAKAAGVPVFSSSGLRFAQSNQAVRAGSIGKVTYAETYGPCEVEPHHPDLFWYGVHGVEALFTVMGTGCQTVERGKTPEGKIEVTGTWSGGRKGVFRQDNKFHGLARGEKGEAPAGGFDGYPPLVEAIMKFFQTRAAPVSPEETLEIIAFMEAADESAKRGGKPVEVAEMMRKAAEP